METTPTVRLVLSPEETEEAFSSIAELLTYVNNERQKWNSVIELQNRFQHLISRISQVAQQSQNDFSQQGIVRLQALLATESKNQKLIFSSTVPGKTVLEIAKRLGPEAGNAAFRQYSGVSHSDQIGLPSYLKGAVAAAISQGSGENAKDGAQRAAVSELHEKLKTLHDEYSSSLEKSNAVSVAAAAEITANADRLLDETKSSFASQLKLLSDEYRESNDGVLRDLEDRRNEIANLEKTYAEKLRLDKPAEHWTKLESKYDALGRKWAFAGAIFSVAFIYLLLTALYKPPDSLELHSFAGAMGVRALILFALIASISVFVIRFCFKMSISAYHLSRDARERSQLTYFYLSLVAGKSISSDLQTVVLQALFSRADTGLLKSEGLSMPGGALTEIARLLKGH
jgi:hypothetical protein